MAGIIRVHETAAFSVIFTMMVCLVADQCLEAALHIVSLACRNTCIQIDIDGFFRTRLPARMGKHIEIFENRIGREYNDNTKIFPLYNISD